MRRRHLGSLMIVMAAGGIAGARGAAAETPKCPSCPVTVTHPPLPVIGQGTPVPHVALPPAVVGGIPHVLPPIPLTVNGCATTAVTLDVPIAAGPARQVPFAAIAGDGIVVSFDPQTPYVQAGATSV